MGNNSIPLNAIYAIPVVLFAQSIVRHILDFSIRLSCIRSLITYAEIVVRIIIITDFITRYDIFDIFIFEIDFEFIDTKEIIELEMINTGS